VLQFMQLSEADRAEFQQHRCYQAHNRALSKACEQQAACIDKLLAVACRPELIRRLAAALQQCPAINPLAARAILGQVRNECHTATHLQCCCSTDSCLQGLLLYQHDPNPCTLQQSRLCTDSAATAAAV
jgi:hypothetical protein